MRSDVAEALAGAVRANPLIRRLSLAGVKWRDMRDQHDRSAKGVTAFAAAMPGSAVTSLDLSDSDIGPSACARLAKALSGKNAVRELDLSGNAFVDGGARAIGELLRLTKSLEILRLNRNCLGAGFAAPIYAALEENSSLLELDLTGTQLEQGGAYVS